MRNKTLAGFKLSKATIFPAFFRGFTHYFCNTFMSIFFRLDLSFSHAPRILFTDWLAFRGPATLYMSPCRRGGGVATAGHAKNSAGPHCFKSNSSADVHKQSLQVVVLCMHFDNCNDDALLPSSSDVIPCPKLHRSSFIVLKLLTAFDCTQLNGALHVLGGEECCRSVQFVLRKVALLRFGRVHWLECALFRTH